MNAPYPHVSSAWGRTPGRVASAARPNDQDRDVVTREVPLEVHDFVEKALGCVERGIIMSAATKELVESLVAEELIAMSGVRDSVGVGDEFFGEIEPHFGVIE